MPPTYTAQSPLRWGIVGCGNVTEVKSGPAFNKVEGSRLLAVMRRDAAKAQDYAQRHGVPQWTTDADALIQNPALDAIYIATPPGSHKDYALRVAAAGKHCCVEKPMALNAAECREMVNAFEAAGKTLFVAYYRRSLPRFAQVKAWIDSGAIGTVRHVHWALTRLPSAQALAGEYNWHTDPAISGGGYFVDLASHGLDLFIHLLGPVQKVAALATNQQGLYPAEDAVSGNWQFASGATGSGYWNFGCQYRDDSVVIHGSQGKIEFSVFDAHPLVLHQPGQTDGPVKLDIPNPDNIQYFHIQNMVRHLNGEITHPSLGSSALQASAVMDEMLKGYYAA